MKPLQLNFNDSSKDKSGGAAVFQGAGIQSNQIAAKGF
jgi:hypothetical protein